MPSIRVLAQVGLILPLLLFGCATNAPEGLSVSSRPPVTYRCDDDSTLLAHYMTLSDGSLAFVRLELQSGEVLTLPQMPSASGARFTDDRTAIWWEKGGTALFQVRDENGDWVDRYRECVAISE
jgi:membrane-bound inhibitor of C-type lysozyme